MSLLIGRDDQLVALTRKGEKNVNGQVTRYSTTVTALTRYTKQTGTEKSSDNTFTTKTASA